MSLMVLKNVLVCTAAIRKERGLGNRYGTKFLIPIHDLFLVFVNPGKYGLTQCSGS